MHARTIGHPENRLKLGTFGANCSSGLANTKVPERWSGSWSDNVALAQMSDRAGLDFILPVAHWKGYGGETNPHGASFETLTWATGLLGATERLTVFGTVHAPLIHPVFASKMCVTADHVGRGRFALNVVCGSHKEEFEMFDAPQRASEDAYAYGAEWLDVVFRLWAEAEPFEYAGSSFQLRHLEAQPKPYGENRPVVLNAGLSPAGRGFAMRYADALFTSFTTIDGLANAVRVVRDGAAALGRDVQVYSMTNVVCRPTASEARDYFRYFAYDMADWGAVEGRLRYYAKSYGEERFQADEERMRLVAGSGAYPCVGDADRVAAEIAAMAAAGVDGLALGFVNYLDELPFFCQEVLPRLEQRGIRRRTA